MKYTPENQNSLDNSWLCRPDYDRSHVPTSLSYISELVRTAYVRVDDSFTFLCALRSEELKKSDMELIARFSCSVISI